MGGVAHPVPPFSPCVAILNVLYDSVIRLMLRESACVPHLRLPKGDNPPPIVRPCAAHTITRNVSCNGSPKPRNVNIDVINARALATSAQSGVAQPSDRPISGYVFPAAAVGLVWA